MEKLKLDLEYCYGIERLTEEIAFGTSNTVVIYASNGIMKTSLANTFKALQNGTQPKDRLFNKASKCEISCDNTVIDKDMISVIKSFDDIDSISSQTKLLVDEDSKREYDNISAEILDKKKKIVASLNRYSGVKKEELENVICKDFSNNDIHKLFSDFEALEVSQDFSDIKYTDIFNKDVIDFLKEPNVAQNIQEYFEKYQSILESSSLFKVGVFNPSKADNVAAVLKKENFFNAEHKVKLKGVDEDFDSYEDLNKRLLEEKKIILENADLLKIEKQIKKVAVKNFRELLEKNRIVSELADLDAFKIKLWNSYMDKERFHITELNETYNVGLENLKEIEQRATEQATSWDNVISKFKSRFFVPFDVRVENKASSILGKDVPNIQFVFLDEETGNESCFRQRELGNQEILSQGEKRAMYLLNVMFNIEERKESGQNTLYIIDDIADSFDYKNKYAIVQYLKELSESPNTFQFILTHNFDFFRTLQSRVLGNKYRRSHSYVTIKEGNVINFVGSGHKYQDEPFTHWKKNLDNKRFLLSSIPFVRNLIEFKEGNKAYDFIALTSLLHSKSDTESREIQHIKSIYESILICSGFEAHNDTDNVFQMLMNEADLIYNEDTELGINLEEKIILSIATRIKAEKYMWSLVSDTSEISNNQTGRLFQRFKTEHAASYPNQLKILEEVNLVTPENIHINSFMFEPIIDLSINHLKRIYNDVSKLID
ncbi:hypothetical protein V6251_02890 [Olleya sp. Ti.3.14]|uniref:hypothetical protein n=1 Tax=Olleya sp. Ti.3.14 TaxID=3121297 RepID=UPI00311FAD33